MKWSLFALIILSLFLVNCNKYSNSKKSAKKGSAKKDMRRSYKKGYAAQKNRVAKDGRKSYKKGYAKEDRAEKKVAFNPNLDNEVREHNTEDYSHIVENDFIKVADDPRSTFSIDVDTASYANVRRFLNHNQMPPQDAIRLEEMINYFNYNYPQPKGDIPFSVHSEIASCPWKSAHRLVKIGLKGREIVDRAPSNLVFLLDVSGSMNYGNKLPLLKQAFRLLVNNLKENDQVAIVVYAGAAGLVLPSTPGDRHHQILEALNNLRAGGSTNGGEGIRLAYNVAVQNFIKGGVNRVILATDGDFNVGLSSRGALTRFAQNKAKSGVYLTILGFGTGNYKDSLMEEISNKANGNYAYIDNLREARKTLVEQIGGTLITIAKDVKIQIEFNPATVEAFRLIGYENRILAHRDFNDDTKDAGEIGAGHTVTAFYEIIPTGKGNDKGDVDPLKYQNKNLTDAAQSGEMLTLKLRYKAPDGDKSKLLTFPIVDKGQSLNKASKDFVFAASVASFGMLLRKSKYKNILNYQVVLELAQESKGLDKNGYRNEFIELVKKAMSFHQ